MEDERDTASLRHRRRRSHLGFSSCFQSPHYDSCDSSSISSPEAERSSAGLRSPTSWFRPEGRGRTRHSFSRLGRHVRRHSADFSYDPLSYARNFDDGSSDGSLLDKFSARLPVSPPRQRTAGASRFRVDVELPLRPLSAERKKVQSPEASADRESCIEDPPAVTGGKASVERRQETSVEL